MEYQGAIKESAESHTFLNFIKVKNK